jgi:hypothetical protein
VAEESLSYNAGRRSVFGKLLRQLVKLFYHRTRRAQRNPIIAHEMADLCVLCVLVVIKNCDALPITIEELGDSFSLKHSPRYGTLPSVYTENDPAGYLASYVTTYFREEMQQEGLTSSQGTSRSS